MDLLNRDPDLQPAPTRRAPELSLDMAIAAQSSLPVLISAPAESAFPMAIEIAMGTSGDGADGVFVVDGGDKRDLRTSLMNAGAAGRGQFRTVVLRDVHAFDRAQQSALIGLLGEPGRPGDPAWRVISTTSVPLFERVLEGSFDSRLFYRLNAIHIFA